MQIAIKRNNCIAFRDIVETTIFAYFFTLPYLFFSLSHLPLSLYCSLTRRFTLRRQRIESLKS